MSRRSIATFIAASLSFATGCVLEPVDLEGKRCPCATGYVCDEAQGRCVEALAVDGSTPDAGHVPPVDDPSTACDDLLSDAIFCESFEDASLFAWTTREAYRGVAGHRRGDAFRGTGALGAEIEWPTGYAERLATVVGGIDEGELHVRAYVFIPFGIPLEHVSILHVGGHRSRVDEEPPAGFNAVEEYAAMYIGASDHALQDERVELPRERWFCVQYMLAVDDVAGEARVWIDGELAGEATGIDTRPDVPYETLGAGIAWTPVDQLPFSLRIDELAVGRSPLPCE